MEQVNAILASFKRLKANAAEGGKPYREEAIEYKDTVDGLNILVSWDREAEHSGKAQADMIRMHIARNRRFL